MLVALLSSMSYAQYDSNISGKLSHVATYADGDYIYFTLENQPTSHPTCDPTYFVIDQAVPFERQNRMLSRLLTAYTTKELVLVGYDSEGNCAHGYIRVHRVG